jgi:hypothetical protein
VTCLSRFGVLSGMLPFRPSPEYKRFHLFFNSLLQKMSINDLSREPLLTLNKDGISDELFKLLWAKDEMNFSPQINIPDTIIYRYGQPVSWYFTAMNGHIKKKNKHNLVSSKIEEVFNNHMMGYDVIAYFISMPSEADLANRENEKSAQHHHNHSSQAPINQNNEQNPIPTVIEYFDRESLTRFLYNHRKEVNGILQRFLDPKTTHNELIRAVWSPKLCMLERAENIHQLHDKRYGLYEKCVTYEGPHYYYTASPLRGPVLTGQLQKYCETAVAHIAEVTFGQKQVSRLALTFKVDSREKLWLLYSTSIRCYDMLEHQPLSHNNPHSTTMSAEGNIHQVRNLLNIDSVITLNEKITLNPFPTYNKIIPQNHKSCVSCGKETIEQLRHPITYKSIIKHYEHVLLLLQNSISLKPLHRKEGTIAWPPDNEIVEAAGGVGFYGVMISNEKSSGSNNPNSLSATGNNSNYNENKEPSNRSTHIRYKAVKDLQIPPILSTLHPKLTSETYLRCKDDPLFYNKTVHVCESCYLVYAEFTTMLLELGENIPKLLFGGNERGAITTPLLSSTSTRKKESKQVGRPSSADWRAIGSISKQGSLASPGGGTATGFQYSASMSTFHDEARNRSIGLRTENETKNYPLMPKTLRSADDVHLQQPSIDETTAGYSSHYSPYRGGLLEESQSFLHPPSHSGAAGGAAAASEEEKGGSVFTYNPDEVKAMIADRERRFFKEISLNPQLKDSHPLQHLISTHQKLALVNESSGVLMSNTNKSKPSLFGPSYGKQSIHHKHNPLSAYNTVIPYIINGEVVYPSELKARKEKTMKLKKLRKQTALQSFLAGTTIGGVAGNDISDALKKVQTDFEAGTLTSSSNQPNPSMKGGETATNKKDPLDINIKNSKNYRDFLTQTLTRLESDVSHQGNNNKNNNNTSTTITTSNSIPSTANSSPQKDFSDLISAES